jgi:hypothetical protein
LPLLFVGWFGETKPKLLTISSDEDEQQAGQSIEPAKYSRVLPSHEQFVVVMLAER